MAFRKERIIVGDKAREMVEKDPANVFSFFKRKMGTMESFFVKNLNAERTPIQLSSLVLRELKNFVYSDETVDSVVITIPASFDTIQSNATKKAGYEADFAEVVLLQEPIAASLAFANKQENAEELGIKVNQSVNPTNAVAIGAAFCAGNKTRKVDNSANLG